MQLIRAIYDEEATVASAEQSTSGQFLVFTQVKATIYKNQAERFFSFCEQSQDLEIPEQFKTTKSVESDDSEVAYGAVVCSRSFFGCGCYHEVGDIEVLSGSDKTSYYSKIGTQDGWSYSKVALSWIRNPADIWKVYLEFGYVLLHNFKFSIMAMVPVLSKSIDKSAQPIEYILELNLDFEEKLFYDEAYFFCEEGECASTYMEVDKENELWGLWFVPPISASYATLRLKFHGTVGQSQHGVFYIPISNGPIFATHCESTPHKMEIHHGRCWGTRCLMKKMTRWMELQTPIVHMRQNLITYMGVDKENELCRLWFVLGISASYATLRLKFHGTVGQSQHGLLRLFDRYTLN
ncbi:hypothetical protein T10_2919 [Trichinella papuae]|uniref:Uncharacterized protein n=1 Tax=Trichinella papuae TaxID=268474 RepID=A0A0V1N8W8_9BILA|nr:hypothetical protein T10_2919 [Trichinella papuae]